MKMESDDSPVGEVRPHRGAHLHCIERSAVQVSRRLRTPFSDQVTKQHEGKTKKIHQLARRLPTCTPGTARQGKCAPNAHRPDVLPGVRCKCRRTLAQTARAGKNAPRNDAVLRGDSTYSFICNLQRLIQHRKAFFQLCLGDDQRWDD